MKLGSSNLRITSWPWELGVPLIIRSHAGRHYVISPGYADQSDAGLFFIYVSDKKVGLRPRSVDLQSTLLPSS